MIKKGLQQHYTLTTTEKKLSFLSRDSIILSVASFISCLTCFYILNTHQVFGLPNVNIEAISCRVIASIHSLVAFFAALCYLKKYIKPTTWHKTLNLSIGYLVFDLAREIVVNHVISFSSLTKVYGHHFFLLLIIVTCFKKHTYFMAKGFLAEITNPILYISWFLIKSEQQDTTLAKCIGLSLLVTFAIFRVYNFTVIYWESRKNTAKRENLFFIPLVLVNYYWFYLIIKKFILAVFFHIKINV